MCCVVASNRLWQTKAEAGNAHALAIMGTMCRSAGQLTQAVTWLTRACDQSHAMALWTLSDMYSKGQGVTQGSLLIFSLLHTCTGLIEFGCSQTRRRRSSCVIGLQSGATGLASP